MDVLRINKYLAQSTGCSRRKAEEMVKSGYVKVNDLTVYDLSTKITYGKDKVTVHGNLVTPRTYVYYAVNKPVGYSSTRRDRFAQKKVVDLVPGNPPTYPAGRLDKNSEGLILLTNDGDLTQKISHPSLHSEKEYYLECYVAKSNWDVRELKKMSRGLDIGGYKTMPTKIFGWKHAGKKVSFYIILQEGKKRQIRRMAQKIGLEVELLRRIRIGKLKLGDIEPGSYKKIMREDIL